jgi:DNA-binding MarR family transcriptional regulator
MRRATRAVTQYYDAALKPAGFRATQYTILETIYRAGPSSQSRLARVLAIDNTTLSRSLKLMIESRWINASPGTDRRHVVFKLTNKGKSLLEKAHPYWERAQEALRKAVGSPDWEQLFPLMDRMLATVADKTAGQ